MRGYKIVIKQESRKDRRHQSGKDLSQDLRARGLAIPSCIPRNGNRTNPASIAVSDPPGVLGKSSQTLLPEVRVGSQANRSR